MPREETGASAAWSAGGAAMLYGISSAMLPHMPYSVALSWRGWLATWGPAFVLVAEARRRGLGWRTTHCVTLRHIPPHFP